MDLLLFLGVLLAVAVAIAWLVLPFAIFGTKPLLRELIEEVRLMRLLLARQSIDGQVPATDIRDERLEPGE